MIRALSTAASGLDAQQTKISNIANDLANVNTDGYKRGVTEFHDLMYQTVKHPGEQLGAQSRSPVGIQLGTGVRVGASHKIFEPGPPKITNHPFDLMIQGDGFFPVQTPRGDLVYARSGAFRLDAEGTMQLANGSRLVPQINVPAAAQSIQVNRQGLVSATMSTGEDVVLGQIQLANVQNPQGLISLGDGLYQVSPASGAAFQAPPGENGLGSLMQGALEGSNVNIAASMVDMISSQRAYELGTKAMGVADQMLQATVNIK
jgi:flagellar basal-body rod protein FlgG